MSKTHFQDYYIPKNPEKYRGDPSKIVFRSSWEYRFCVFLDNNPNVIEWASEEIAIPYLKPTDPTPGKVRNYYPDFFMRYKNKSGDIVTELIEIKPATQTRLRKNATVNEKVTYAVNIAKWKAAESYCDKLGIKFRVLTEDQLFK